MAIDMRAHGKMVNVLIMEFINMLMEIFTMVNGEMTLSKDTESLKWQQAISTKVNGKEERKMERVFFMII